MRLETSGCFCLQALSGVMSSRARADATLWRRAACFGESYQYKSSSLASLSRGPKVHPDICERPHGSVPARAHPSDFYDVETFSHFRTSPHFSFRPERAKDHQRRAIQSHLPPPDVGSWSIACGYLKKTGKTYRYLLRCLSSALALQQKTRVRGKARVIWSCATKSEPGVASI
jgi:hypothetical protein